MNFRLLCTWCKKFLCKSIAEFSPMTYGMKVNSEGQLLGGWDSFLSILPCSQNIDLAVHLCAPLFTWRNEHEWFLKNLLFPFYFSSGSAVTSIILLITLVTNCAAQALREKNLVILLVHDCTVCVCTIFGLFHNDGHVLPCTKKQFVLRNSETLWLPSTCSIANLCVL